MRWWKICVAWTCALTAFGTAAEESKPWVVYEGFEGPGDGKHIVLVSGDEEYRSEEALPQLGKILAKHHGFKCTVLFPIEARRGLIDPNYNRNIPGLEALATADLMLIATRYRDLSDKQMQHIDGYLESGKPVIGLRTATHAFKVRPGSGWEHYSDGYQGDKEGWRGGFGRVVLGEKWIAHHGGHKQESTRGVIAPGAKDHPILRGIESGDIWGPTDVYAVRLPLPGDSTPLVLGQVVKREGDYDDADLFYGMRPSDDEPVAGKKNDPMMPIAWTKTYQIPGGERGKVFTTTMGASTDLLSAGLRRLIVNAAYWCLGMDAQIPEKGTAVALVGEYTPTQYAFRSGQYWRERGMAPGDHAMDAAE